MMFTNSGNMGLPIALLAFGETGFHLAVLVFVASNLMHFNLGTGDVQRAVAASLVFVGNIASVVVMPLLLLAIGLYYHP